MSDAEREAQIFLELLAEEEENGEDNDIEQEEESDSFTEISKESDDDDDFLIQGLASTSIRQRTDTFGNPIINQTRTTSARHISRPSADNDGNDTDDSLDDYLAESGNLTESTYEEIDFSDVESTATDSTIEDGWHNVSRDN
ncbi:hypothetical protein GLOIN_2v1569293 [Rhizophagus irregularis DAOM 181602=DAOM 197198]|nr:hypothetical protein GLOIN_2v1569293 [Rhizophagus irregularis DAOM 181602=DAOM 197198]